MGYDFNQVTIQCRLCKDPEMRDAGGKSVVNFSVAVGSGKEKASFFDIQAWEKLADFSVKHLKKGSAVIISGHLSQQHWEDKTTGGKRSKVIISATTINFQAGGKKEDGGEPAYAGDPASNDPMKKAGLIANEPEYADTSMFSDEDIPF